MGKGALVAPFSWKTGSKTTQFVLLLLDNNGQKLHYPHSTGSSIGLSAVLRIGLARFEFSQPHCLQET
jgi:hypothetical protein